ARPSRRRRTGIARRPPRTAASRGPRRGSRGRWIPTPSTRREGRSRAGDGRARASLVLRNESALHRPEARLLHKSLEDEGGPRCGDGPALLEVGEEVVHVLDPAALHLGHEAVLAADAVDRPHEGARGEPLQEVLLSLPGRCIIEGQADLRTDQEPERPGIYVGPVGADDSPTLQGFETLGHGLPAQSE